eukprot:CAMPEP_0185594024 /NCGR_PEP_ID=MMETSP0434-20130131/73459_1 /TAXON_ID=626734 ORGANISM="Favella taraikaensis, Strain Fe Narragansett Bay" /NCGR_SAMPLE_ID=MMETSP0434 /ASSEMBLY_ACC=CAM_ASM_000379 /LENGTH=34 /DNA_ID= /DNA_START= /DNA_END= /DNA_ORIENTATION=
MVAPFGRLLHPWLLARGLQDAATGLHAAGGKPAE